MSLAKSKAIYHPRLERRAGSGVVKPGQIVTIDTGCTDGYFHVKVFRWLLLRKNREDRWRFSLCRYHYQMIHEADLDFISSR